MSVFLSIPEQDILFKNDFFFIIADRYPVSPGHLLIISNEVREDYFHLSDEEKSQFPKMLEIAKSIIESQYKPDGYNLGMNCGLSAGQTIFHFHCHVIPRYKGDMENPRGGVRHCVAGKGDYKIEVSKNSE
jgi:diadenosine tetraphosphate (Ap4A) HIT family hydrolase